MSAWTLKDASVIRILHDVNTGRVTVVYQILNSNGYELPMTGGPGVGRLTAIGLLLTLGAGFALLRRRRVRL